MDTGSSLRCRARTRGVLDMSWEPFRHPFGRIIAPGIVTIGTTVTISIDLDAKLVMRRFDPHGTTVCGAAPTIRSLSSMRRLFENEVRWLRALEGSRRIPRLVEVREDELSIIQEYVGPDLYERIARGEALPADLVPQIVEMYREYREHGLFKGNGDPRNLGLRGGEVVAFDFKWAAPRHADRLDQELSSIRHFLSELDRTLVRRVLATFTDFPASLLPAVD